MGIITRVINGIYILKSIVFVLNVKTVLTLNSFELLSGTISYAHVHVHVHAHVHVLSEESQVSFLHKYFSSRSNDLDRKKQEM